MWPRASIDTRQAARRLPAGRDFSPVLFLDVGMHPAPSNLTESQPGFLFMLAPEQLESNDRFDRDGERICGYA